MTEVTSEKKFDRGTAKPLLGCVSAETAFIQPDYPYGRRLRCQRRVWVETKPRHGQRFVTQTTNPKWRGSEVKWNTPAASTYGELIALWVDDKGFVATDHCSTWDLTAMKAWGERNPELLAADEYVRTKYAAMVAEREAYQAKKAAGEIKVRITRTEWVPGQGIVRLPDEIRTVS